MNRKQIIELAGHRQVPEWVIKLVMDCVEKESEALREAWNQDLQALREAWNQELLERVKAAESA